MSIELLLKDRELTLNEILELGWQVYRKNFRTIFPGMLFYSIYGISHTVWYHYFPYTKAKHPFHFISSLVKLPLFYPILFCLFVIPMIFITDGIIQGEKIYLKQALKSTLGVWLPASWAYILLSLVVFGAMLLLIIPGVIWFVYLEFVAYAVVLEKYRGIAALGYSKGLVKGRWWRIFGIVFVLQLIFSMPFAYFAVLYKFVPQQLYMELIKSCLTSILGGFTITVDVILFRNLQNFTVIPQKTEPAAGPAPTW